MRILLPFIFAPSVAAAQLLPSPTAERCAPAPANTLSAAGWLDRAAATVLPPNPGGRVLRYRASHDVPLWEQSDRSYEPFIPRALSTDRWVDIDAGVEARHPIDRPITSSQFPSILTSAMSSFAGRDTTVRALVSMSPSTDAPRVENAWLVLAEWRANAGNARVVARCFYRDDWRIVLERNGTKLYVSEFDATPVKFERIEPHYLWGQVRAEYVWSTWWGVSGGGYFPYATFRVFDGSVYERIGVLSVAGSANGALALVSRDSAPRLNVSQSVSPAARPPILPTNPDTVRIAPNTYLLVTPSYTETVALRRDTVFILDATSNEARARADSAMIATLFPGKHPVVVVVTDLAWPHISGVRFWVARGATIVSHASSRDFLTRVTDRKWTLNPDALETTTPRQRMKFRAVGDSLALAGGDIVVYPLRGTSAETAIGVWLPKDRYFWAGDYIQSGAESPYTRDVVKTVRALGIAPVKVGAQHIKLTDWSDVEARVGR